MIFSNPAFLKTILAPLFPRISVKQSTAARTDMFVALLSSLLIMDDSNNILFGIRKRHCTIAFAPFKPRGGSSFINISTTYAICTAKRVTLNSGE